MHAIMLHPGGPLKLLDRCHFSVYTIKYNKYYHLFKIVPGLKMMTNLNEMPLEDTYDEDSPDLIKVSARSRSTAVAGAIAGVIRQYDYAEVQAIGAGAVNQAVKALAIARGYLERDEIDIVCTPFFTEVDIDGNERTAVRFKVEARTELSDPLS